MFLSCLRYSRLDIPDLNFYTESSGLEATGRAKSFMTNFCDKPQFKLSAKIFFSLVIQRDPAFKKVDFKKVRHYFSEKSLIL